MKLTVELEDAPALALAHMCKRFLYEDAVRFISVHDAGVTIDDMLDGIAKLQAALHKAGVRPR